MTVDDNYCGLEEIILLLLLYSAVLLDVNCELPHIDNIFKRERERGFNTVKAFMVD
jgi:hypothetical protein